MTSWGVLKIITSFYSNNTTTYLKDLLVLRLAKLAKVWGSSGWLSAVVMRGPSWLREPVRDPGPSPAATSSRQLKKDAFCTTHPKSRTHPNTTHTCAFSCHSMYDVLDDSILTPKAYMSLRKHFLHHVHAGVLWLQCVCVFVKC